MTDASARIKPLVRTRQFREFTDQPISDDEIQALANVARWSGSAGNSQPWRFIVVRDIPTIRRLAELGHPQTRSMATAMAAMAITLPDDANRTTVDAYDEGRVAERLLIAATMLGLGAGIGWVRQEKRAPIGELLGVPGGRYVRTIMAVGHPSERAREFKTQAGEARIPLERLVSYR